MTESGTIVDELRHADEALAPQAIDAACRAIESHQRVFTYATGRSGLMLKACAMRLMQLGRHSFVVGETTTPSMRAGDLLVIASASGETPSVVLTATSGARQGADLFVVSTRRASSLAKVKSPDVLIRSGTKYDRSAASVQPLGSLFEQMLLVFFDAVILRLSSRDDAALTGMAARHASLE